METIDIIIYLGRVKSAIDDMQALQEHEVPHSTECRVSLRALHDELLRQLKARPDHARYVGVTFADVANNEGSPRG